MKIGITHFSKKGLNWFEQLSRKKQKDFLVAQGNHEKNIKTILKGVKYAKLRRNKTPNREDK